MAWAIFKDSHLEAIRELTESKSERVVAIVGVTFLDDTLKMTLTERFRNDPDICKKLLKVGGALGNTGPKIDLLYLLGAIDEKTRTAMEGLTKIRNAFAHILEASFASKDQEMREGINKLGLHHGKTFYPNPLTGHDSDIPIPHITNDRDKFIVNLQLCLIAMMRDRGSHIPWTNIPLPTGEIRPKIMTETGHAS